MPKKFFDRDNLFKDAATGRIQKEKIPVTAEDRIAADKPVNRAIGGIMHTVTPEPSVVYDAADNEQVISNGNSYIVLGSDRPGTKASGFGAQGTPSSTIDLVVGRMASAYAGEGPRDGMLVNSNFAADSARIYISQLTDLDTNFGIATGKLGKENPRSGIGIKADHVRIIGREGVKIVSGGMQGVRGYGSKGETNSQGGELESASKIELIAGNNTSKRGVFGGILKPNDGIENLQPVVKGENMERCLEELSEIISLCNNFYVTYDTGNITSYGLEHSEYIDFFADKINNVHLKDRTLDAKTVPPLEGHTDFETIFKSLKRIGYEGPYILQTARSETGKEKQTIMAHKKIFEDLYEKFI